MSTFVTSLVVAAGRQLNGRSIEPNVVEIDNWMASPSAGAILADLSAM